MSATKLAAFAGQDYLNLETYKRDGAPVRTPMWFVEHQGALFAYTHATAGKLKRIRRDPRVRVAPSDVRGKVKGAWLGATVRIEDAAGAELGEKLLREKYGWKKKIGDFFIWRRGGKRVVLSIRLD